MAQVKRCPTCGAQNAASAEWCTLCLARFDGVTIPPPKPRSEEPVPEEVAEVGEELAALAEAPRPPASEGPPELAGRPVDEDAMLAEASRVAATIAGESAGAPAEEAVARMEAPPEPERPQARTPPPSTADATTLIAPPPPPVSEVPVRFLRDGDRVRWVCPTCETSNDIDLPACRICGTVMARLFAPAPETAKQRSAVGRSLALSALLPGLGHAVNGAGSAGAGRGVLYVWTLFIAILLLVRPPASGRAMVTATGVVFAIAAGGVWGVSMVESRRLATGDRTPVLSAKAMTWVSAGLTLALFLGLAAVVVSRS